MSEEKKITKEDIRTGNVPGKVGGRGQSVTEAERQYIREHWKDLTDIVIGEQLGRHKDTIKRHREDMGLIKNTRKEWTDEEEKILKDHYADTPISELDEMLPRWGRNSIYSHAHLMGLYKDEEYLAQKQQENGKKLASSAAARETQFKSGHTPFNKGMEQEEFMSPEAIEKTKATRFKAGHKPYNTAENGEIRIRHAHEERGEPPYMWIRLAENEWKLYHRHVWEQEHGPIPEGHLITFKNGNTLDPRPENLEMITMAENANRNRNPEKASKSMKEYWENNPHPARDMSDRMVAAWIAWGDEELKELILEERPDMIEAARAHYKLKRQINNYDGSEEKATSTEN